MAIALGGGGAPSSFGPGFRLAITGVAGPVAPGDFLQAILIDHSGLGFQCYGTLENPSPGFNLITMGWDDRNRFIMGGGADGSVEGVACDIEVWQYDSTVTIVDHIAATPWGVLDCHSYAWCLLRYAAQTDLAAVLAAVRTTFPSTA